MTPHLLAFLALAAPMVGGEPAVVYAVVVANNQTFDGSRPALRFADDDGVRYAELFAAQGTVALFTTLDGDSQRLYREWVGRARPAKRAELHTGLVELFAQMKADREAGRKVVFYFVYSGHGEVGGDSQGYVHLLDGPWTRADLFTEVLAASPASVNHVLIDACNAFFMVAARGGQAKPAGDYTGLIRGLVSEQRLAAYPNTGVLLSTSSATEVHEWGRVEAGVFSHVIRSALSGAADADSDGAVDYDEAAAFVAAANGALPDKKTRLEIFARAPAQDLGEPLLTLSPRLPRLAVPAAWAGRFHLEDDRGVRFADFHKTGEAGVELRLVPRPRYYLRAKAREWLIEPSDQATRVEVATLAEQPLRLAARGSVDDAFTEHLFAIPFGAQFVVGYRQAQLGAPSSLELDAAPPPPLGWWRVVALGSAGGLAVASGSLELWSRSAANDFRTRAGSEGEIASLRGRAESLHRAALITGGIALTAAVGVVVAWWLED